MQDANAMHCLSRDSKARPSDYRADALPTEASHHIIYYIYTYIHIHYTYIHIYIIYYWMKDEKD